MTNYLKDFLRTNTFSPRRLTIKNKVRIVDTDKGCFVFKKNNNINLSNTYKYLKSRAFDYFPNKLNANNAYDLYEYIEDIDEPIEQKGVDIINLLVLLHSKTTFYKEIDIEDYKKIYEETLEKNNYLINYYTDIIDYIESEEYMSPSKYLLARNINIIFESLEYVSKNIKKWYKLVSDKQKMRVVNIHNNVKLDHYIKNSKPYFISWENSRIDMPIYDLYNFYQNHYLDLEFSELFRIYETKYPLTNDEQTLLFILMMMPSKIMFTNNEYLNCHNIRLIIDYLYKTKNIILEYDHQTPKNA